MTELASNELDENKLLEIMNQKFNLNTNDIQAELALYQSRNPDESLYRILESLLTFLFKKDKELYNEIMSILKTHPDRNIKLFYWGDTLKRLKENNTENLKEVILKEHQEVVKYLDILVRTIAYFPKDKHKIFMQRAGSLHNIFATVNVCLMNLLVTYK